MPTFAIISEGVTDQAVLEVLLDVACGIHSNEAAYTSVLQPRRDETDRARAGEFGGWEAVLEYCALEGAVSEALLLNDYLVIQIDTDSCEEKNFGVSKTINGVHRPVDDIVSDVVNVIKSKIHPNTLEKFEHKLIFAISVHSIECWLLAILAKADNDRVNMHTCEQRLRHILQKEKIHLEKNYRTYTNLMRGIRKINQLTNAAKYNRSLKIFLDCLTEKLTKV
ncbi:hypothetical protein [Salinarimonas soli]|uniref:Uncharacterized protein n=1 Tax=Salinarimonas soli TaxID=1638099 RepID=A0A5B2V6T4_9HYPH|nr:hypothetical protein [Salinarimonas soli]KAA2234102.1 hypothetical protein F0L46_24320 [Salinarimonas soli]